MSKDLGWWTSWGKGLVSARSVDGDGRDKVIFGGRGRAQVKYADVGV